jgi:regulatory protein
LMMTPNKTMEYKECYGAALRLLNVRFLSENELRRKLLRRGMPEAVIDEVVEKLKEERFIDDERLAEAVYRYYVKKAQYGHAYICNRLRLRDLSVPDEREPFDETVTALALTRKTFKNGGADQRKIARFLQNRGFSITAVQAVLADFVTLTEE